MHSNIVKSLIISLNKTLTKIQCQEFNISCANQRRKIDIVQFNISPAYSIIPKKILFICSHENYFFLSYLDSDRCSKSRKK